jgi:uracil-DNA glycosylase
MKPRHAPVGSSAFDALTREVRSCTVCAAHLPAGPRPVFQVHPAARILIAGQAPGRKVHESGVPFDDASGERLRQWMGVTREVFYDATRVAILPMGFCFPGTGRSGDLPPRPECAPLWRQRLLDQMPRIELTLVIGAYAQQWHLPDAKSSNVTNTVADWRARWPVALPMPHPSPRNNIWLKINPWFVTDVVPALQRRVAELLAHRPASGSVMSGDR